MQTYQCPTCGLLLAEDSFCPKDGSKAQASEDGLQPGAVLDKYIAEAKIGEGGMGEVWRGRHSVVHKQVAIKLLSARFVTDKNIMLRFRREAQAVNEIRNKHLIDIFDFGELPDGRPYFVMEYLEGKSLSSYLEKGPLSFSELLPLFEQLCRGLQAAHDRGIIHRDLKPDNIFLVMEEGQKPFVKILDFGIAKLANTEEGKSNITRTGAVFGTPTYMSPEQCEGTKTVDHRSDLYSLGIILCEMICGRTPFAEPGDGTGVVMAKHIMTPAPAPSSLVSGRKLPASIDAVVLRALAKDPSARPQKAIDFYNDLVAASKDLQNEDISQAKPLLVAKVNDVAQTGDYYAGAGTKPPVTRAKKSPRVFMLGAGLSLLMGALATYLILSWPQEEVKVQAPDVLTPSIDPTPLPMVPQKQNVHLSVKSSTKASVFLQNAFIGETPLELDVPYSEEEATLRIQSEGFEAKEIRFTPKNDFATEVELKASKATTKAPAKKGPKKTVLFSDD